MDKMIIDITFDVRTDSKGKDPDSFSKTLKSYHKALWSKHLPNGQMFDLVESPNNRYLYHKSELGEYALSSDSVVHTYKNWQRTKDIIRQIPEEDMEFFYNLAYTVGGFMLFPGNKVNGLNTMNQERGTNKKINDRLDLTLECIRRYYNNETSPMYDTINRYDTFFRLFNNFKGYCEHFLLQDLVSEDYSKVNFFLPFNDFVHNPLPKDVEEYMSYKKNNIDFLNKRNARIVNFNIERLND